METPAQQAWRLVLRDFLHGPAAVAQKMADAAVAAVPRPLLVVLCKRSKKCYCLSLGQKAFRGRRLVVSKRATHRGRRVWKQTAYGAPMSTLAVANEVLTKRPDDLLVAVVDGGGRMVRHERWLRARHSTWDSFVCDVRRAFESVGETGIV